MGTDSLESMGHPVTLGNQVSINLEPDTEEELDRLFAALSEGGKVEMEPADMFWGDRDGQVEDPFGHLWWVGTHVRDVDPQALPEAARKACD